MDDSRELHRAQVEQFVARRDSLPASSHVRAAITKELIAELRDKIETTPKVADLDYGYWPCIFGFVLSTPIEAIRELDDDIGLVLSSTESSRQSAMTRFLGTRATDHSSRWYGGLFELWAKATLVRRAKAVEFDVSLTNGRDRDIVAEVAGRQFNFECSVITQDDESRDVWDRFIEDRKANPTKRKPLVRPGPYDLPNSKGPSPYYMPLRLYGKFFDKLTKDLDPTRGQIVDDQPNIILVCFAGPGVHSDDPSVNWAIEELFANHPKIPCTGVPEGFTDISLPAWADFTANNLIAKKKMSVDWYCDHSSEVIGAPRRLGAAMLFDGTTFAKARMNYNAHEQNAITHAEMAELERILTRPCRYWR